MEFRIHQISLNLFFALAFCFSFSIEASAHDYQGSDGQHLYTHSKNINISATGKPVDIRKPEEEVRQEYEVILQRKQLEIVQEKERETLLSG